MEENKNVESLGPFVRRSTPTLGEGEGDNGDDVPPRPVSW